MKDHVPSEFRSQNDNMKKNCKYISFLPQTTSGLIVFNFEKTRTSVDLKNEDIRLLRRNKSLDFPHKSLDPPHRSPDPPYKSLDPPPHYADVVLYFCD